MTAMSDPKLKIAMKEVEAVLKKHDVAAFVLISSKTHMEYLYEVSPSWSCARLEGRQLKIRGRRQDYLTDEDHLEHLQNTVGIFMGFGNACARAIEDFEKIAVAVGQQADIQHFTRYEKPDMPEEKK